MIETMERYIAKQRFHAPPRLTSYHMMIQMKRCVVRIQHLFWPSYTSERPTQVLERKKIGTAGLK